MPAPPPAPSAPPAWSPPVPPPLAEPPVPTTASTGADDAASDAEDGAERPTAAPAPAPSDSATEAGTDEGPGRSSGPRVDAIRCPAGHPNPPGAEECRVCGAAITDQTVTEIGRPTLGRLTSAEGADIELDRPAVIGRKPPETATIGDEDARVITIADADTALSRSHAEIRLSGWDVQVVDLGSTNHTYVTLPGEDPVQLRPNEPFTIPVGAVVSLGVAVRLTYEV